MQETFDISLLTVAYNAQVVVLSQVPQRGFHACAQPPPVHSEVIAFLAHTVLRDFIRIFPVTGKKPVGNLTGAEAHNRLNFCD